MSRGARIARGFALAGASALVASLSHVAGGGGFPAAVLLIAALLLSGIVSVAATGSRVALWRTAVAVTATQLAMHAVFSVGETTMASAGGQGHSHAAVVVAAASHPMPMPMPMNLSMLVPHLLAAAVTVLLLRFGEGAFWAVTDAARHALRAVRVAFSVSPREARRRGVPPISRVSRAQRPVFAASIPQRGPPAQV